MRAGSLNNISSNKNLTVDGLKGFMYIPIQTAAA